MLSNHSGSLAELAGMLSAHNILLLGCFMHGASDAGIARIVTTDPDATATALMLHNIPFTLCEVIVVELPDGADALLSCLNCLNKAESNVELMYPLFPSPEGHSLVVFKLDDQHFCSCLLNQCGFKVCFQEDLSR